jgi:hypothetical protein
MINTHARANTERENDLWLARLAHVQTMLATLRAFIDMGSHLEDCLATGEGRDHRTFMGAAVDEMQAALDSLEREERRIRRELDERGIAP